MLDFARNFGVLMPVLCHPSKGTDRHHPLPWGVLHYDSGRGGYVVNLDKKMLEDAPMIGSDRAASTFPLPAVTLGALV